MTIDIITALDQAFFQAETAQDDQVRTQAIQHFINVAGIMEQQLRVAGMDSVTVTGYGKGEALPPFQHATLHAGPAAGEQPVPPTPDVVNMADPRNWQAGDVVKRKQFPKSPNFTAYSEYTVAENDGRYVRITGNDGTPVSYPLDMIQSEPASSFFTWLRHGDAPTAQA